jgi:hypothetical protein
MESESDLLRLPLVDLAGLCRKVALNPSADTATRQKGHTLLSESIAFPQLESLKGRMVDFLSDKFIFFR